MEGCCIYKWNFQYVEGSFWATKKSLKYGRMLGIFKWNFPYMEGSFWGTKQINKIWKDVEYLNGVFCWNFPYVGAYEGQKKNMEGCCLYNWNFPYMEGSFWGTKKSIISGVNLFPLFLLTVYVRSGRYWRLTLVIHYPLIGLQINLFFKSFA